MIFNIQHRERFAIEIAKQAAESAEKSLMKQMNELIGRDLLAIEVGDTMLIHEPFSNKVELRRPVTLKLKDLEYIESLEAKVKSLTEEKSQLLQRLKAKS